MTDNAQMTKEDRLMEFFAQKLLSPRAHFRAFAFWAVPGMALSVALSVFFGAIVGLIWMGIMSAYANMMLHLIEHHHGRDD